MYEHARIHACMFRVLLMGIVYRYDFILEWTTSLDTSSSTLFVCRPGTVSSGIYRPPQVIPAYPPGGDTRIFFICSRFPRGHYLLWLVRFSLV